MKTSKLLQKLKNKETAIVAAAVILPGGFVMLGLWKMYDLLKKRNKKEKNLENLQLKQENT